MFLALINNGATSAKGNYEVIIFIKEIKPKIYIIHSNNS